MFDSITKEWQEAAKQYEAIRRDGKANMLETRTIQLIASRSGFHELVLMIEEMSSSEYFEFAESATEEYREDNEVDELVEQIPEKIEIVREIS